MKRRMKQIVSFLLVICMCMLMLPQIQPEVHALTPTYSVSSSYASSSYYSSLLKVALTGNQREDIINVALSQVGYREGNYSGDYNGADDGYYNNYTEYNYWYNNYISSDMPVGGSWAPWCATFVSWCAEQANIPTSILQRSTAAGHGSWCFNVNFYSGSGSLASSSDDDSYFMGYNYTPKRGDLFFTRSWSHVGLVVDSDGTYVTTVEGNTNNDGSADGFGVFVRTRYVDDLYFGVPEYEADYASSCTYYPSHCQISVDAETPINSQPCSVSTSANSENLGYAAAGQTYTATGLYQNSYGNYWYRVESDLGDACYLYAGDTTYIRQLDSDISFTDYDAPNGHVSGSTFTVSGTIDAPYNQIDTAACYIYSGFGNDTDPVTGYSASVGGHRYTLDGSTVDYNTSFGSLSTGNHTYEISITYSNYYATSNTSISSNKGSMVLLSEYFVVVPSAVDQSSCSHTYTTTSLTPSTCTKGGTGVKSCSKCGIVSQTTVEATGHSYGSWNTVAATCIKDGSRSRTCSACGHVETQILTAGGHDYDMITHAATCTEYEIYEYTCANCGDNYKLNAGQLASGWIDHLPQGLDSSLFISKTQYRYRDHETKTSSAASMSGYTLVSSDWVQSGSGKVDYVSTWPSGFSTGHSLYSQYNKASSKVTAGETATAKTVVNSDKITGYLYYHWCYEGYPYTVAVGDSTYDRFHAYYSTTAPEDADSNDVSDDSYRFDDSTACSDSVWYFYVPVYSQSYTTYTKQFTYERWSDWSAWSDTSVAATDSRQVESRTVYQLKNASVGGHSYQNGICVNCGDGCSHSWSSGKCSLCGASCSHASHTTAGICKTCGYAVGHRFTSTVTKPTCNAGGYTTHSCQICGYSYQDSVTAATAHSWTNGVCGSCGTACNHSYSNNVCTICGTRKASSDYYLFGWINGGNYACEENHQDLGEYKFVGGKLNAFFNENSYVAVKSGDNQNWYMLTAYYGENVSAGTMYNTSTGANEKLFVPGGMEITFTLMDNGDDSFTLSYVANECSHASHGTDGNCTKCGVNVGHSYSGGRCTVCGAADATVVQPTLTLKYPSLSFESEILYNVYFIAQNTDDVVDMGLLTYESAVTTPSIDTADAVVPGFETDGTLWKVNSKGVSAKKLGDDLYFAVYAQLTDGSYVYTAVKSYNAVTYANTILSRSTSSEYMKSLVVAMLNYGTQAQLYFGHNTDRLMNAGLSANDRARVAAYNADMMDDVVAVDTSKTASIVYNGSSYTRRAPSVSFDGAFSINYYFTTANVPEGDVKLYYWTLEDYNAATTLKPSNATGKIIMTATDVQNQYWGQVAGIAAKELDETVFVAGFYTYNGTTYSTGVLNYSIGKYCEGIAAKDTSSQQGFAQATAVYGFYAKEYFANL